METGDDDRGNPAPCDLIKDFRTTADMFSSTVLADKPAVPDFSDIGYCRKIVAHRVTDSEPLNLLKGTKPSKIIDPEILGCFTRDLQLP